MLNWLTLIKERFSPASYVPMILLFTAANGMYLSRAANYTFDSGRFLLALLLMLSFFFRLRCFDEIKDYEVDLKINPTRPLARGLLSIAQVKKGLFFMVLFELLLSAYMGFWVFLIHALAIFYSLLMYEEFFVGDFLRPRLTTYAVTHTFVSVLLGISAATAITGFNPQKMQFTDGAFFLMNWAYFNLFEFARKTFAPDEERPQVPSYSQLFKPRGAWLLSWSQVIVGVILAVYALKDFASAYWLVVAAVVYTLPGLGYARQPQLKTAKIYRLVSGVYLLLHYGLLILVIADLSRNG